MTDLDGLIARMYPGGGMSDHGWPVAKRDLRRPANPHAALKPDPRDHSADNAKARDLSKVGLFETTAETRERAEAEAVRREARRRRGSGSTSTPWSATWPGSATRSTS